MRAEDRLIRASILDFRPKLENQCKVLPVYALLRASILDFKPRLGNRCMLFQVYTIFRTSILDFKPRLENRCRLFPVYALLRASILDFRARLANRCSIIVVTVENGPPATAVAATTFRVRFCSSLPLRLRCRKVISFACRLTSLQRFPILGLKSRIDARKRRKSPESMH